MEKEETTVIFRKWRGKIIAIFPEVANSYDWQECLSYMGLDQHSLCNPYLIIQQSRLAKPEEYQSLFEELEKIGCKLRVLKKMSQKMDFVRRRQVEKWKKEMKNS